MTDKTKQDEAGDKLINGGLGLTVSFLEALEAVGAATAGAELATAGILVTLSGAGLIVVAVGAAIYVCGRVTHNKAIVEGTSEMMDAVSFASSPNQIFLYPTGATFAYSNAWRSEDSFDLGRVAEPVLTLGSAIKNGPTRWTFVNTLLHRKEWRDDLSKFANHFVDEESLTTQGAEIQRPHHPPGKGYLTTPESRSLPEPRSHGSYLEPPRPRYDNWLLEPSRSPYVEWLMSSPPQRTIQSRADDQLEISHRIRSQPKEKSKNEKKLEQPPSTDLDEAL